MTTNPRGQNDLIQAYQALDRRDRFTAAQLAIRTAGALSNPPAVRCDAYLLLARTALQLDLPETALASAIGANLLAHRVRDERIAGQAEAMLRSVLVAYPDLSCASDDDQKE